MKKLLNLFALFVVTMLTFSMVSALDSSNLDWGTVKVNGDVIEDGEVLAVEEGQDLNIRVGLVADSGAEDVEVEVEISGYEYSDFDDLDDSTHLFDIAAGTTKYVNLDLTLPKNLDKDEYWLRFRVLDKNSEALTMDVRLAVEPTRHGVDIADVVFSPGSTVKAGRSLLTTVLLQNFGDKHEEDVKVTVSMPELGISASEFVDVVRMDDEDGRNNVDYEDVPEIFLPLPATAEEGDYAVEVTVKYDDLRETVTETYTVHVTANEMFQTGDQLVLAVGPETQTVSAGKTGTFALALTNSGYNSKAYLLEANAGSWATATLSDNLVVLEPGKNKVAYLDLAVSETAAEGEHVATVAVKSADGEVLETIFLNANVAAAEETNSNFSLRNGLEVALIVLVVLIVIIGLIIGFSRLRKDDDEEEQTYY